jgi:hypothetical protein
MPCQRDEHFHRFRHFAVRVLGDNADAVRAEIVPLSHVNAREDVEALIVVVLVITHEEGDVVADIRLERAL